MDEAAIRAFVARLRDVRDFALDTTAVDGWPAPQRAGPAGVAAFLREGFEHALRAYVRWPARPPCAVATVESAARCRLYAQGPCETVEWLLARVRHEMLAIDRPWLFVLAPAPLLGRDVLWQEWAARVAPQPFFNLRWLVEVRGRGAADRHHGLATLVDHSLRIQFHCELRPPPPLDGVLRGHPARRRHPIRRHGPLDEPA